MKANQSVSVELLYVAYFYSNTSNHTYSSPNVKFRTYYSNKCEMLTKFSLRQFMARDLAVDEIIC